MRGSFKSLQFSQQMLIRSKTCSIVHLARSLLLLFLLVVCLDQKWFSYVIQLLKRWKQRWQKAAVIKSCYFLYLHQHLLSPVNQSVYEFWFIECHWNQFNFVYRCGRRVSSTNLCTYRYGISSEPFFRCIVETYFIYRIGGADIMHTVFMAALHTASVSLSACQRMFCSPNNQPIQQ